jgi:sulfatase maturation enzyme AslB (radical SAM superfamily)
VADACPRRRTEQKGAMVDLSGYEEAHRKELEELLGSAPWQEAAASGLVEQVRQHRLSPGKRPDFIETVVAQLLARNQSRVRMLIAGGNRNALELADALGSWPATLDGSRPRLSFLGLNVTSECNCLPRCEYCNQPHVPERVGLDGWKAVIDEVAAVNQGEGPYIYLTGGEPLVLGEQIWGPSGLIQHATRRGAAVNLNTNALQISPAVALRLVGGGLARLHISLDTADEQTQNLLMNGDHWQDVLEGIYNVQLARELVGVSYPEIHTNCVLTRCNWRQFPELFRFILSKRRQTADRQDPLSQDLFPHVIPVGGKSNAYLRLSGPQYRQFYTEIWPQVTAIWDEYQAARGVPPDKRGVLFGYFSNPFLRVEHAGGLEAYVEASAQGRYGALALARHCYVAPTQASFTPDGLQFRCGSHAIRRLHAIGQGVEGQVYANIGAGLAELPRFPDPEECAGCALATLYVNQAVERKLAERVRELLAEAA